MRAAAGRSASSDRPRRAGISRILKGGGGEPGRLGLRPSRTAYERPIHQIIAKLTKFRANYRRAGVKASCVDVVVDRRLLPLAVSSIKLIMTPGAYGPSGLADASRWRGTYLTRRWRYPTVSEALASSCAGIGERVPLGSWPRCS